MFHHKNNCITIAVGSYSLHNLKFIGLLRLQHLWHHQATQSSRVFQSFHELCIVDCLHVAKYFPGLLLKIQSARI